ncbi:exodeoxyribonuclease I [uncultured Thiodictyon sp.]|uniref:exodeoxyribonuclease I n=1 Tax=uncultured Thiodictyon sp. TaxID=1846217 RepID=UPI0025E3BD27|nr:exodeoxyribonuclease I [uncultured Thiodictyon sp.]
MTASFYWHDYETWGADPRRDRPCQFAGLRTDADLNPVGEPLVLYCRPALDLLPQPEACLITGITPQLANEKGVIEAEFTAAIADALAVPDTCGTGYNSIRFDDEVTRHLFYRNLRDPYAREWQNGNSRWDLIDTLRLAQALRPEGITWPLREDGTTSFRLTDLTNANAIPHTGAHDALADVQATIAVARLLRGAQPRLYDYALTLRDKRLVRTLLEKGDPLLHASARFPAALGCIAPVVAVAPHPTNNNGVICLDLRTDPQLLLDLTVEELRMRLFTPSAQLPAGVERIPLKTVKVNHSPVLAPLKTLPSAAAGRWSIDPDQVVRRASFVREHAAAIRSRVQAVHQAPPDAQTDTDPDLMLYCGGFLSDADRRTLERIRQRPPTELADATPRFADPRLPEMVFRYRARNWPEILTPDEREAWDAWRLTRLTDPQGGGSIQLDQYEAQIAALGETHAADPAKLKIIDALTAWAETLMDAGD